MSNSVLFVAFGFALIFFLFYLLFKTGSLCSLDSPGNHYVSQAPSPQHCKLAYAVPVFSWVLGVYLN